MTLPEFAKIGRDYSTGGDGTARLIELGGLEGYDFITVFMSQPRDTLNPKTLPELECENLPLFDQTQFHLGKRNWAKYIMAKVSPWIDADSPDRKFRDLSKKALFDELSYFDSLKIPKVLIEVKRLTNPNLAHILNQYLHEKKNQCLSILLTVPTCATKKCDDEKHISDCDDSSIDENFSKVLIKHDDAEDYKDTWLWFYRIRSACLDNKKIGLALKFTPEFESDPDSSVVRRWYGEPLKCLIFDTSLFSISSPDTNNDELSLVRTSNETIVQKFFTLNVQILLTGEERLVTKVDEFSPWILYFNKLYKGVSKIDAWSEGYEDYLHVPNSWFHENVQMTFFEYNEFDTIKYDHYSDAICGALRQRNFADVPNVVIMILGAGRGPLVTVSVEAVKKINGQVASTAKLSVKIYAVEKNIHAVTSLNYKARTEWSNLKSQYGIDVEVVYADMRDFRPVTADLALDQADIVVSELLGSFGDNELSPECLDGALHLMKPDCICIPQNYTSYVAPLHSPKLHETLLEESALNPNRTILAFESVYVVRIFNHFLPAPEQPLFTFEHPNFDLKSNDRYKALTFIASETCDVTGLVGYFHSQLFKDVTLSIVPKSHTHHLISWFQFFLPLKSPVYVKKGQKIVVNFWRRHDASKVWYEWSLSKPVQTPIMNNQGRSSNFPKIS